MALKLSPATVMRKTCYWATESARRADKLVKREGYLEECREQCFSDVICPHAEGEFCMCGPDLFTEHEVPEEVNLREATADWAPLAVHESTSPVKALTDDSAVEFSARLMSSSDYCLSSVTDETGYVVAVVFSGRQKFMHVLVPYLERLMKQCSLHEVHMWDYTYNRTDHDWLQEVAGTHSWPLLHTFQGRSWTDCYDFYSSKQTYKFRPRSSAATPNNTVLIKLDDDIVYIDTWRFDAFTRYVRNHHEKFIVHANTVNNGVAAYYQTKHVHGMAERFPLISEEYPMHNLTAGLYGKLLLTGPRLPTSLHIFFLNHVPSFHWFDATEGGCNVFGKKESAAVGMQGQGRISVNFFGARWEQWDKVSWLVQIARGDDEHALTTLATKFGFEECIFTGFNVAHFSFGGQHVPLQVLTDGYENLLKVTREHWATQE